MTTTDTLAPAPLENWQPRFFTIWGGQAISLLGSQMVQFALIWYLTQQTGSATTLAIAALVGLLPTVVLSPLVGTLVDRWDRRAIMMISDVSIALATVVLALLFAFNVVQIWHIYVLMFIRAVGGGFQSSASGASTVLLVPKDQLARVQGMNQALNGGMNIFAAPLGALLLKALPMQGMLSLDIISAIFAVGPLFFLAIPKPPRSQPAEKKTSVWIEMREGFQYVLTWPGLMVVLLMATLINFLLTPTLTLMPLLVTQYFHGDALQLGWLEAATGGGIIAGGLLLTAWGGFKRRMLTALTCLIVMGAAIVVVGLTPANLIVMAIASMAVMGIMNTLVNGSMGAILQAAIAPDMQGRVFALVLTLATAMSPLGLIIAGPVADRVGVQAWFWVGGGFTALLGVIGLLIPAVFYLEDSPRAKSALPGPEAA